MIEDTHGDPVFAAHQAARAFPIVGSYIGVPIMLADGAFFGTLCAVDPDPHTLRAEQVHLLAVLARFVATQIERDREVAARQRAEAERALLLTHTKEARRQAEADRDRFQRILDILPEAVLIADARGHFLFMNRAAMDTLGLDLNGQQLVTSEDNATVSYGARYLDGSPCPFTELPLQRAALRGEELRGQQLIVRNATTGQDVPVLINAAPLHDASGALAGGVAVFQDITTLRDLDRTRDEFLSSVSHDLKTPLTIIRGQTQLMQRWANRAPTTENARLRKGLATVYDATTVMVTMLEDLLDLARLQMGRALELDRVPTDLAALVRRSVEQHRTGAREYMAVEAPVAVIAVVDGPRIARIVANLLSNAVKYSPEGGAIIVRVAQAGEDALIAVADHGIGIPTADLPRIFERFYRASNAIGRIAGTGIGLVSARDIALQHGGNITIDSTEGVGTTVTLRLPLAPSPPDTKPD